jgi:hypothetical protein
MHWFDVIGWTVSCEKCSEPALENGTNMENQSEAWNEASRKNLEMKMHVMDRDATMTLIYFPEISQLCCAVTILFTS